MDNALKNKHTWKHDNLSVGVILLIAMYVLKSSIKENAFDIMAEVLLSFVYSW